MTAAHPDLVRDITELARRCRDASRALRAAKTAVKDTFLGALADRLEGAGVAPVLEANALDVVEARGAGLSAAMIDRLVLDERRLATIAGQVRAIARLADPVGSYEGLRRLPSGLLVGRMRVPLGVVGMIYESRPNVTIDAAALCVKSGNAALLRGGSEAHRSNRALTELVRGALRDAGLPPEAVSSIATTDRDATRVLVGLDGLVDLVIPRGGEGLIRFVTEHARVPVIRHYKGVCHVYVDGAADLEMAAAIVVNAKTQRPGVCNAMETLLVDAACAAEFLPRVGALLTERGVTLRADARARALLPTAEAVEPADWDTEHLDLVSSVAVVDGLDAALAHVARHGTQHTEAIVTEHVGRAERWVTEVDASCVLVNASTRFNDGGELGLGAEMGISTTKLHAYGPMGLAELTTLKWVGFGRGETRA